MGNKLEIRVDTKDIKKRRRKPTTIPQSRPLDPKRQSIKRDPKKPSIKDLRLKNFSDDMSSPTNQDLKGPLVIFETDGQEFKFSKGGRVGLKGGGICKKGMNKKAFGKNS